MDFQKFEKIFLYGACSMCIYFLSSFYSDTQEVIKDKNSQMFSYEFPQKRIAFVAPSYNSEKQAGSRLPDFRHTLYWNPEITSAMGTLNFYTSDMNGIYIITLQGISVDGREIRMQSEFVVGANH